MKKAIVIGSNGPKHADPLRYARNDAVRFAHAISRPACGFTVDRVADDATAHSIREQLFNAADACRKEDTFLCYFSGHGILEQGELYLLLETTDTERLLATALGVHDLVRALQYCKADSRLLILDCCHAGAVSAMLGLKNSVGIPIEELNLPKEHFCILMASGRLERASEIRELRASHFTHNLIKGLTSDRVRADVDGDGAISIDDISRHLSREASSWNRVHPDLKVPIPQLLGRQKGQLYLLPNPLWEWTPIEITWPNGIILVPLPVSPFESQDQLYAPCISKYPITNSQYFKFVAEGHVSPPKGQIFVVDDKGVGRWKGPFDPWADPNYSNPDHPVVCVSYHDAVSYCSWFNDFYNRDVRLGGIARLPGKQFWEFAAFGKVYRSTDPSTWLSHAASTHHKSNAPATIDKKGDRTNLLGVSDMIGNVWEWCAPTKSYVHTPITDANQQREFSRPFLGSHDPEEYKEVYEYHLRGGGFLDDISITEPELTATLLQDGENTRHADLGFRIAARIRLGVLPTHLQQWLKDYEFSNVVFAT
jgi:formylglycine-generating enzyme required for sulfatase activity